MGADDQSGAWAPRKMVSGWSYELHQTKTNRCQNGPRKCLRKASQWKLNGISERTQSSQLSLQCLHGAGNGGTSVHVPGKYLHLGAMLSGKC